MSRILIIGYGNDLRGDDGFGPRAAARLRGALNDPGIEILALHQLTPELMEPVSRAERVIFLDAALGPEPGKMNVKLLEAAAEGSSSFTHFATPAALLAGARALYGRAPEAVLLTVTAAGFELGEGLSAPVESALNSLVDSGLRRWIV